MESLILIKKPPPCGVVVSVIFGKENHGNPSHCDLHIESFNSYELEFSIEYQYNTTENPSTPAAAAPSWIRYGRRPPGGEGTFEHPFAAPEIPDAGYSVPDARPPPESPRGFPS